MSSLADLAKRYNIPIQTHISESGDEVSFSKSLHPSLPHDTAVLNSVGLLTKKSILGHATIMGDEEYKALAKCGCGIAHCALSNFFVSDRFLRVQHVKRLGVKVGLGTDVAGGYRCV